MKLLSAALVAMVAFGILPTTPLHAETRVLILVGPTDHPPGTHEVAAGGRLIQWAVHNMSNVPGVKADVIYEWPTDKRILETANTIFFIGDTFPPQRMPETAAIMKDLEAMMARGAGIVCVHYATGLRTHDITPEGAHPLLQWLGGYFATKTPHHQSVARVFRGATISPTEANHPVLRGWKEFTIDDEPYYNNYFGPNGNKMEPNVTAFATAMLPLEAPKREVVSWGVERKDGGRGFAIVMPHFYKNWANDDLRKFIMNAIVWSAKLEVPQAGVQTPTPDLTKFGAAAVEPPPRPQPAK